MQSKKLFVCLIGLFLVAFTAPNIGRTQIVDGEISDANICDKAAANAARETGVPLPVLQAVARTESGITIDRRFVAWPWTLNLAGQGVRFSSLAETHKVFQEKIEAGLQNIDVGCFQINYRWHAQSFRSSRHMLDPHENAKYAAAFLKELFEELGSWVSAVGAYHSRNPDFSESYLARYRPILEQLTERKASRKGYSQSLFQNNEFPLLKGNSDSGLRGSLFPKGTGAGRSLFGKSKTRG